MRWLLALGLAGLAGCGAILGYESLEFDSHGEDAAVEGPAFDGSSGADGASRTDGGGSADAPSDATADVADVTDVALPFSTTDLLLWLSADKGIEGTLPSVSAWRDQSGANNDATQIVSSAVPQLETVAGRPMISMTGGGLDGGRAFDLPGATPQSFADFSAGLTGFAVVDLVGTGFHEVVSLSSSMHANLIEFAHTEVDKLCLGVSPLEGGGRVCTGVLAAAVRRRYGFVIGSNSDGGDVPITLFVDGAVVSTGTLPGPPNVTRTVSAVGGLASDPGAFDETLQGYMGELLLFRRALSPSERSAVDDYLAAHW